MKNKSQGNKKRLFYYFDIDSYTRVITMIYYTKIKKENNYKFEVTYYKLKIQNKTYLNPIYISSQSCSSYLLKSAKTNK